MQNTITIDFDNGGTMACMDFVHTGGNTVFIHAIAATMGNPVLDLTGREGTLQFHFPTGETEVTAEVPTAYFTGNGAFTASVGDAAVTFESVDVSLDDNVWVKQLDSHRYRIIGKKADGGVTYPLSVENGGTGVTTVAQLKELLSITDSGWKTLDLAEGVTAYESSDRVPSYRKIGNRVFIEGTITVTPTASTTTIATIPVGFRPKNTVHDFVTLTGKRVGRLYVAPTGVVNLEWAVNISDGRAYTTATWMDINLSYFVD